MDYQYIDHMVIQRQHIRYHDDPLALYQHITHKPYSVLLESAEINTKAHLNSFMLTDAAIRLDERHIEFKALTKNGCGLLDSTNIILHIFTIKPIQTLLNILKNPYSLLTLIYQ